MFIPYHDENPIRRLPLFTVLIIVANVAIFWSVSQQNEYWQRRISFEYGCMPARLEQLVNSGPPIEVDLFPDLDANGVTANGIRVIFPGNMPRKIKLASDPASILLTLITCMFLHGSFMHILGNMWFLWLFGNNIEDRLGGLLFLVFYLVGGAVATLAHVLMASGDELLIPVIGASGAVAVMLGAYAVTYPKEHIRVFIFFVIFFTTIRLPALLVLGAWLAMQLISGFTPDSTGAANVAWWAHVGGFLFGVAVMPFLPVQEDYRGPKDSGSDRHTLHDFGEETYNPYNRGFAPGKYDRRPPRP